VSTVDLITEYESHLKRERYAEITVIGYIKLLRRMDRELPAGLAGATTDELEHWIFASDRASTTLKHYVTVAQGFAGWATNSEEPRLDYDAAALLPRIKHVQQSRIVKAATPEQVADVLARAGHPYLDLFILAAFGGYRCVEIHRARREHVGKEDTRIFGKGGKWRTITTHPRLWEHFKDRPTGPLALDREGKPLNRDQVIHWGDNRLRSLGYDGILSMHSFRKFFGTQVYEASGRDIRVAQELLGHVFVTTTQKYIAVNKQRSASAVLALDIPDAT
jgi:integrase